MKILTEEYQVVNDEFKEYAEHYGCSCHINPPCAYCTHEGNPLNLEETPEAWKEVNEAAVKKTLTNLLNECLESMNQEHSFKVTNTDLENMKFSVDFDIVMIEDDSYVGFNGY